MSANPYRLEGYAEEFRLVLACARWPLRERDREAIVQLAARPLDWERFVKIIERNQIVPLAYRNLDLSLSREGRPKALDVLRGRAMGLTSRSLAQAAELVRITEAVKSDGIEIAALKGVTLSMLAYGNLAMRSPGDIDLLVAPAHVFEVEHALLQLGYVRVEPKAELTPRRLKHYLKYYKHLAYFSAAKGLPVELHWRLYNTPLTKFYGGFSDTVAVPLVSGTASTLPHDELFLYLCVHGALHGWPILKWLADIGAMLRGMNSKTLGRIVTLASKQGFSAELQAALMLVDELLAIERPAVEFPAESNPIAARIVAMAHRLLTADGYCLDLDRLPGMGMFFYDLRLRSSWEYRRRDLGRAFVLPEDWELVNLPDALFPLYAAVRPVSWLLRRMKRWLRRRSAFGRSSASTPAL